MLQFYSIGEDQEQFSMPTTNECDLCQRFSMTMLLIGYTSVSITSINQLMSNTFEKIR
jgi:hypothetical protein